MTPFHGCECGCRRFAPGPRGGASINIGCLECGVWYNVVLPTVLHPGPVLLIEKTITAPITLGYIIEVLGPEGGGGA